MEIQLENNIINAISLLFRSLAFEDKAMVIKALQEELSSFKPEIIESLKSKESFLFDQNEFENISNKLLQKQKVDFEPYKSTK